MCRTLRTGLKTHALISRKQKWTVSAPEECSWCSFGLSFSSDLKIIYRENLTYCKEFIAQRLASGIRM